MEILFLCFIRTLELRHFKCEKMSAVSAGNIDVRDHQDNVWHLECSEAALGTVDLLGVDLPDQ